MNSQPERVAKGTAGALEPVGPSADCQDRDAANDQDAQPADPSSSQVGGTSAWPRRSGTPVGVRGEPTQRRSVPGAAVTLVVIALTFGNQSDWSRNVRSAGGGTIRIEGEDYDVTQPQIMSRQEAKPLVQAAFSPDGAGRLPHARHQAGHDSAGGASRASAGRGSRRERRIAEQRNKRGWLHSGSRCASWGGAPPSSTAGSKRFRLPHSRIRGMRPRRGGEAVRPRRQ